MEIFLANIYTVLWSILLWSADNYFKRLKDSYVILSEWAAQWLFWDHLEPPSIWAASIHEEMGPAWILGLMKACFPGGECLFACISSRVWSKEPPTYHQQMLEEGHLHHEGSYRPYTFWSSPLRLHSVLSRTIKLRNSFFSDFPVC